MCAELDESSEESLDLSQEQPELSIYDTENVERIVNGAAVDIRRYPHQVSLRFEHRHLCGASIISPWHCLTAAHCFKNILNAANYSILAGTGVNSDPGMGQGVIIQVAQIIRHEEYVEYPIDNDIALLVLATALPIDGRTIRVAALPPPHKSLPFGQFGSVSGW